MPPRGNQTRKGERALLLLVHGQLSLAVTRDKVNLSGPPGGLSQVPARTGYARVLGGLSVLPTVSESSASLLTSTLLTGDVESLPACFFVALYFTHAIGQNEVKRHFLCPSHRKEYKC